MVTSFLIMKAKKQYGQNFLIDEKVLEEISNAVFATEKDLIIEIGPGRGALTKKLLEKGSKVIAYEIDTDLIPWLNKLDNGKLQVIYKDVLKSDIKEDIKNIEYENIYIVGNLPYYITTPIIEFITKSNIKFKSLVTMVQKEVADRFTAVPKTKNYGYFTLYLKHYYDSEKIINVGKEAFNPAPKVLSAVVKFIPKAKKKINEEKYFAFLKECFKEKRKTLRNNLKNYNFEEVKKILSKYNLPESVRSEELPEEVFYDIYNEIIS